jgi:radical SAM superfamily enzyme YgiQ (UPF0313 family)
MERRRRGRNWPRAMREPPPLDARPPTSEPLPRHALLINPYYPKDPVASFGKHVLTPSLALTSIAGATPPGWDVRIWDENLLQGPPPTDPFPSIAGITVHLTSARRAYDLARWYREGGARVVLGGLHIASCPEEAAPHADAIAVGPGVDLWPRILRDAEAGRLAPVYTGSYRSPYRDDPPPARHLLDPRDFLTTASLIATRGCRNRCRFCWLSTEGVDMPAQERGAERIAAEFQATGQPYGVFLDNNLGSRPAGLRSLCRALAPLEKIWSAAITGDIGDDPALVREMALAGCTGVFVGFESLSPANLEASGKAPPGPGVEARRVEVFHRNGIQVNGSFIFGFDQDGPDVFERTVRWIEEVDLECATFHILTPYPGTPLFRDLEVQGRILHRDWSLYDTSHAVFRPLRMSPAELEEGHAWAYRRLFPSGRSGGGGPRGPARWPRTWP